MPWMVTPGQQNNGILRLTISLGFDARESYKVMEIPILKFGKNYCHGKTYRGSENERSDLPKCSPAS